MTVYNEIINNAVKIFIKMPKKVYFKCCNNLLFIVVYFYRVNRIDYG